jgi:outer membrane protein insertion porin family
MPFLPLLSALLLIWTLPYLSVAQRVNTGTIPEGTYNISGVTVEGADFSDKKAIIVLSGLTVGKSITIPGDDFSNAVKQLWSQNLFSNIGVEVENVKGNDIFLVIRLEERPRISKYTFSKGVTKSHSDDLREKINFVRGQRFTESKRKNAIRVIRNFYQEKGFFNVEVDIKTKPDPEATNSVIIVCEVKKNQRVKIESIDINGNQAFADRKLLKRLKDTKPIRFYRFWKQSKYIPFKYNEEKGNIVKYLNTKGYKDAELLKDTVIRTATNRVVIKMDITEGKKYFFRNISWTGNVKHSSGLLDTVLSIKKGTVYNPELLERRLLADPGGSDVSTLYLDEGHLFFRAEPVESKIDKDSIDLEIQIYEGPIAKYDRIFIEGNNLTSDFVIQRQIRTLPGQTFSRSEIMRSQREILNLGYFNQENMQILPQPKPDKGTVDIKYIVEEKPNNQFFLQGGWGGRARTNQGMLMGSGLIGTVGLRFNNFSTRKFFDSKAWRPLPSGDGQQVAIQMQLNGFGFQNYSISFMEPWLGGRKPINFGVTANYSIQRSLFNSGGPNDFYMRIVGTSVDLGQMMKWPDDYFRSFTTMNYRYYDVKNAQSWFEGFNSGFINVLSFQQAFDRTSINVPIFPQSGSVLNFSVEATPPWSLFSGKDYTNAPPSEKFKLLEFHKWKFRTETYLPVTQGKLPMVLFARAQFGFLGLYNRQIGLSPFERFFLGGDGLIGFQLDGREIIALRGYDRPNVGGVSGRTIFNKFTFELRQPLSLSPQATVWFHLFAEGGNGFYRFNDYNPFLMARSAGGGIRIFLPMFGLLGVDYGYGFDDIPRVKNRGNFHFMIGQQF